MPKKKTIPPPDDFSSEFMETEFIKELSEQQAEAADSDNTETPLAEPSEVDLGSGGCRKHRRCRRYCPCFR